MCERVLNTQIGASTSAAYDSGFTIHSRATRTRFNSMKIVHVPRKKQRNRIHLYTSVLFIPHLVSAVRPTERPEVRGSRRNRRERNEYSSSSHHHCYTLLWFCIHSCISISKYNANFRSLLKHLTGRELVSCSTRVGLFYHFMPTRRCARWTGAHSNGNHSDECYRQERLSAKPHSYLFLFLLNSSIYLCFPLIWIGMKEIRTAR